MSFRTPCDATLFLYIYLLVAVHIGLSLVVATSHLHDNESNGNRRKQYAKPTFAYALATLLALGHARRNLHPRCDLFCHTPSRETKSETFLSHDKSSMSLRG